MSRRIRPACFNDRMLDTVSTVPQDFETRMAAQRKQWAQQDLSRFRNPDRDDANDREWRVYAYVFMTESPPEWVYLGQRPIRRNRRKPMTMNRLFASARAKWGVPRDISIKLITATDDDLRLRRGHLLAPPVRFPSLRPY